MLKRIISVAVLVFMLVIAIVPVASAHGNVPEEEGSGALVLTENEKNENEKPEGVAIKVIRKDSSISYRWWYEYNGGKVVMPQNMSYVEIQNPKGESGRVNLDDFPSIFSVEVPVVRAGLDLVCGDKTYTVKTGNNQGTCVNSGGEVTCADNGGNTAGASCEDGCIGSSGSGSCSAK